MYCRRCGKELPPNTTINFCPRCGGAITTVPKTFKIGKKNLRILGVIVGIWTVIFLVTIIDYNIRLSNVRESAAVGLGILYCREGSAFNSTQQHHCIIAHGYALSLLITLLVPKACHPRYS